MNELTISTSLKGRSAVVTGAASGLGQAIAHTLAAHGARVICLDLRDAAETVRSLEPVVGFQHQSVMVDVADSESVAGAFEKVDQHGLASVDILVNCAGIREIESVLTLEPQAWDRVVAVNLSGTFYVIQQAARRMAESQGGSIINVSSVAGLVGMANRPAYTATKHAVLGLTKNLARDLAPHRIRVNAVAPGTIRTPLTEPYYSDPEFLAGVEGAVPLGFEGSPGDVANAVLFFASDLSTWVSGTVLPVDGGWLAEKNYAPAGSSAYMSDSTKKQGA